MNTDYLEFDTSPSNEQCVQVGDDNYRQLAILEANILIDQLCRTFPKAVELGLKFKTVWNPHDFGSYLTVNIVYRTDREDHDFVYEIERNFPENWDEISISRLMESKKYTLIAKGH